jgi:hypothetical protein
MKPNIGTKNNNKPEAQHIKLTKTLKNILSKQNRNKLKGYDNRREKRTGYKQVGMDSHFEGVEGYGTNNGHREVIPDGRGVWVKWSLR